LTKRTELCNILSMTRILPITKVREDLTNIVDRAKRLLEQYVITVNGSPAAVIMSAAEYESWKETSEILSDPGLVKAIKKGEEDIAKGHLITFEQLKKDLHLNV